MNIRHECPMSDLSFSVTAPLYLHKANGCKVTASRWSLAGIWLEADAPAMAGETVLCVPFQGVEVSFSVSLTATDTLGHYQFAELTVRQRETLSTFYQGVLSGQMVSAGEMITSLDTPVDLVPMHETEAEEAAGRAAGKPRLLRIIWNMAFYTAMAALLTVFLGGHIWQRLSRIDLEHARFTAPILEYVAPGAGYVARLNVAVGDDVAAGDILARIEDPDRESDVEDVRAEVLLAERRLKTAEDRLARHLALYQTRRAALWAAFSHVWEPWQRHDPRALVYPPAVETAWRELYAFDRGRDTVAGGYFDLKATLEAGVAERELDLRRWKRELRHRKAAADKLLIRARTAGTVYAVHAEKGGYVGRNTPVIDVEDKNPRRAVAWLDDAMATRVHVGMTARIAYVYRDEAREVTGTVTDVQAGTNIAQPDRFGMILTIQADDVGVMNSRKWFRRNAPAQVSLDRVSPLVFWKG
ncbi:HlyD family efflux transporter periplasmic adaptor subunit [uncultured Roseobacter sp.]|uniref:HlyD family secretion protein n=1 Tax=uncultured Roseobacter sp. TaxID=114847 RepID=UPI00262BF713|nr:HlyD family efflux transporter periplasmic adaptor subunit [uncultured Roseobacter sp.]